MMQKEINFFTWHYHVGLPWYLSHPEAPARIRQHFPDVKIIALLRNPIDRAYSQYQMNPRKELETLSFEDAIAQEPARLAASPEQASTG